MGLVDKTNNTNITYIILELFLKFRSRIKQSRLPFNETNKYTF